MSRNLERLGVQKKVTQTEEQPAVGLDFVVPTEFVDLPSKGVFYPEGHPLHGVDTIEMKQMTAKEEDILTNKSFIKKGILFDRLLSSIVMDKKIRPQDLLVGDRNALVMAARISGYGEEYKTKVICPLCLSHNSETYDLEEIEGNGWEQKLEDTGVELDDSGLFVITLPKSGLTVKARPLNGHDEKALATLDESDTVTGQLKRFVVEVDGQTDKKIINKFIDTMLARDAKYLRLTYKRITPNLDFEKEFECTSCGHEATLEVRLGPDFFWFE